MEIKIPDPKQIVSAQELINPIICTTSKKRNAIKRTDIGILITVHISP